jgi:hypothetical protein
MKMRNKWLKPMQNITPCTTCGGCVALSFIRAHEPNNF